MMIEAQPYCSVVSREVGETLYGTASHVNVWFLLEYNRPWGARATEENDLPAEVQGWLQQQVSEMENGRLQFIRQQIPPGGITFFILAAHETSPRLYRFLLDDYRDLLTLNIPAILSDLPAFYSSLPPRSSPLVSHSSPFYLVCTNAKRDRCCGIFGAALYRRLSALAPGQVWQTTHLGGHRFAPTIMTLPDGVYYGRISPDEASEFLAVTQQGHLYLPGYRGRSCYAEPIQVAEYHLRQQTGHIGREFQLVEALNEGTSWLIRFRSISTGLRYTIHLEQQKVLLPIYASCGKPETKPVTQYQVISQQV